MAMLYGASGGTLYLSEMAAKIATYANITKPLTMLGLALIIVGFGFKVASVPFHMWTPDVYEGAPTNVTAFMAVGVKAAAFAAFARVMFEVFPHFTVQWNMILWVLAVATMTVGNVVAIAQTNIKRMLAYSSIAHAGYLMVALVAANELGATGLLYYLLAYTLMNIGAFGVVILVGRKKDSYLNIYDYAGLGFQYPGLAAIMALFMFALAGMPPTAGFIGKFYIFSAAIKAGYIWLAIIGVMNSWCRYITTCASPCSCTCARPRPNWGPYHSPRASPSPWSSPRWASWPSAFSPATLRPGRQLRQDLPWPHGEISHITLHICRKRRG